MHASISLCQSEGAEDWIATSLWAVYRASPPPQLGNSMLRFFGSRQ
jgi:hypothetical protein